MCEDAKLAAFPRIWAKQSKKGRRGSVASRLGQSDALVADSEFVSPEEFIRQMANSVVRTNKYQFHLW